MQSVNQPHRLSQPSCTVVVPVYNRASVTRQCLNTLLAHPPTVPLDIVVVDDGSRDLTPHLLADYGDQIRVVTHAANEGFASACNDGAALATGAFIIFLNNDTLPQPGWLDALVDYAQTHPQAAVVGSKLLYPNNTIQHAGITVGQDLNLRHLYVGLPADFPAALHSRRRMAVTGACFLLERRLFERLGGFGFVAHGDSPKGELSWSDWAIPFAGLEIVNLDTVWRAAGRLELARAANRYMEQTQPWTLAKNNNMDRLAAVLATAAEAIRVSAIILSPVIPAKSRAILRAPSAPAWPR